MIRGILLFCLFTSILASQCASKSGCEQCTAADDCKWCFFSSSSAASCVSNDAKCDDSVTDDFFCPTTPNVDYNDTYTRSRVLPLIAAINALNDSTMQSCVSLSGGAQLVKSVVTQCRNDDYLKLEKCAGFVAIDHSDRRISLIFRGSKGLPQFISQGMQFVTNRMTAARGGGKIIDYYGDAVSSIVSESQLDEVFVNLTQQHPDYEILLAGHSLGGALASVAALRFVHSGDIDSSRVRLVTFGQPRTGDVSFARRVEREIPYHFRVVHNRDLIPQLPLRDPPTHFGVEVWYPNDMKQGDPFRVSTRNEDPQGRASLLFPSMIDHVYYFNRNLDDWPAEGCPM